MARPVTDPARPASAAAPVTQRPKLTVALACIGVFVICVDITIVSVALPRIGTDLHVGITALPWVVNAYTIAFAGALLPCGRLVSNYGPERCYAAGAAGFGLASLACGLAPDFALLIIGRALQGVTAALLMPTTLTLITAAHPAGAARAKALGLWSAVGAVGGSGGTAAGGILTQLAGWRWIFLVNVPIIVGLTLAGWRVLSGPAARTGRPGSAAHQRLDLVGAGLAVVGLSTLVYGVLDSTRSGWGSGPVLGALAVAALAITMLGVHQRRWSRDPLIPSGLLGRTRVSAANATIFLLGLGFFASSVLVSSFLQDVAGYSPLRAGLALAPLMAAMFVGAQLVGRLLAHFEVRRLATAGSVVATVGFAGLSRLHDNIAYWPGLVVPIVLVGFGVGFAFTPITAAATDVTPALGGVAAGVLNTSRQVAAALGLAGLSALAAGRPLDPAAGYGRAFLVATATAALAVVCAATLLPRTVGAPTEPTEPVV